MTFGLAKTLFQERARIIIDTCIFWFLVFGKYSALPWYSTDISTVQTTYSRAAVLRACEMKIICLCQVVILFFVAVSAAQDIFDAIGADNEADIENFLANGADINKQQAGSGQSPLMNAVLMGKIKAVQYLLKRGADVNVAEKDGYTPMHGAGFQGRAEIAKVLIDHGVPVNDVHSDGFNPIMRACWGNEERHTDTVRVMLENGAILRGDEEGITRNKNTRKILKDWRMKKKEDAKRDL